MPPPISLAFSIYGSQSWPPLLCVAAARRSLVLRTHLEPGLRLGKPAWPEPGRTQAARWGKLPAALPERTTWVSGAMRAKPRNLGGLAGCERTVPEKVEGMERDGSWSILSREFQLEFRSARDIYHFFCSTPKWTGRARLARQNPISSCQL